MSYGTHRGLPRYDSNTLQPIRGRFQNTDTVTSTITKTFSRRPLTVDIYSARQPPPPPLTLDQFDVPGSIGTVRSNKQSFFPRTPLTPATTLGQLDPVVGNGKGSFKWSWERRLYQNYSLGIHRLFFLTKRLPALAGLAITIWLYFGRHRVAKFDITEQEKNVCRIFFSSTLFTLLGGLLGSGNHHSKPSRAVNQTWLRLGWTAVNVAVEVGVLVFAIIALVAVSGEAAPEKEPDLEKAFSIRGRITQLSVELGLTLLLLVLGLLSAYHGIYALVRLYKDKRLRYDGYRSNVEQAAYSNALATIEPY